jgi:hypothetical protein
MHRIGQSTVRLKRQNQGRGPRLFALMGKPQKQMLWVAIYCPPPSKCYQGNIFPIALPIFFVLCNNTGLATLVVQYKIKLQQHHIALVFLEENYTLLFGCPLCFA